MTAGAICPARRRKTTAKTAVKNAREGIKKARQNGGLPFLYLSCPQVLVILRRSCYNTPVGDMPLSGTYLPVERTQ